MKPLITKLTNWKKIDEDEEFVDKAIDSLYKKLKTKNGAIEDLQYAINNPHLPSKCVTIPRSLDGRLQVSHRKGLPHVIYCRIFRWPDLQTAHELRGLDDVCAYTFAAKQTEVCVNPYHYERVVDMPILPPVLVPKCVEFSPAHSLVHLEPMSSSTATTSLLGSSNPSFKPSLPQHFVSSPSTSYVSPHNIMEDSTSSSSSSISFSSNASPANTIPPSTSTIKHENSNFNLIEHSQLIHYEEPPNWCSIVYYELNTRVGEVFYAAFNDIFVDGYTNPCHNYGRRLCLGMFSNVNRNSTTENCRRHIGRGIHIYNDRGDVYIENLSEAAVFIQSRNCNADRGFHPNTVCKLPSAYSLRVFRCSLFAQSLREAIEADYEAVYDMWHQCVVRVSFVKGWGADYYRQDVSACPCWCEMRLNGPFHWLDKVLKHMGASTNPITSVS